MEKKLFWVSVRYVNGKTDELMYEAYNWRGASVAAEREAQGNRYRGHRREGSSVRTCVTCGKNTTKDSGRCTNGRCSSCHRRYCTPGGDTSPGHGLGVIPRQCGTCGCDLRQCVCNGGGAA